MKKIVINKCFGGFGLSKKALGRFNELCEDKDKTHYAGNINREHLSLIKVVEELGDEANSWHSKLSIVAIPDDVNYQIDEYDGREHIAETHRTWR